MCYIAGTFSFAYNGYCFRSSSLLCAVGLYIKWLDPQCLLVITEVVRLRFDCLSNHEFDGFDSFRGLFAIIIIKAELKKSEGNLG